MGKRLNKQILHWFQDIECFNQIRSRIDYKQRFDRKVVNRTIEFRFQYTSRNSNEKRWNKQILQWFQDIEALTKFDPESITNKHLNERGLIEPSNSDFNAPVVIVGTKDETIRFCTDFRKMNDFTNFDTESITNKDTYLKEG